MKHTRKNKSKGHKGPGHEYWGRRSAIGFGKNLREPGRFTKTETHRAERRQAKEEINEKLADA